MIGARPTRCIEIKLNVSTSYNDSSCRTRDSHSSLTHIFAIAFHGFSRLFGVVEINVGITIAPMHASILKNIDFFRLTRRRKELQLNGKRHNEFLLLFLSNLIIDGTFRISSSTTVYGIPRIFIWNSSDRLEETGERRTGLRLRVRRRWLSWDPIEHRAKISASANEEMRWITYVDLIVWAGLKREEARLSSILNMPVWFVYLRRERGEEDTNGEWRRFTSRWRRSIGRECRIKFTACVYVFLRKPRLFDRDRCRLALRLRWFDVFIFVIFSTSATVSSSPSFSPANCLAFVRASLRITFLASSYDEGNNSMYLKTKKTSFDIVRKGEQRKHWNSLTCIWIDMLWSTILTHFRTSHRLRQRQRTTSYLYLASDW